MRPGVVGLAVALTLTGAAHAAGPAWVVKDADSEMLIFGSVHLLPPDLAWRPAALDAALASADDIWFELPQGPEAEQEAARLAGAAGVLPPGRSLFALMAPADVQRLLRVAATYGVPAPTLDRLEPWLAEVALSAASFAGAGASTTFGVEHVVNGAASAATPRRALETPSEQIAILDQAPMAEQLASLAETLRELEEKPDGFARLVRAWSSGDVASLENEAIAPLRRAAPALFERLVNGRNARWARALDARLKGRGRTVVIVGVGHLVGAGSVPERLRALGYEVSGP